MSTAESYFRRREAQERALAETAQSDIIREIHLSMAERYQRLADEDENRVVAFVPPVPEA